jgi:hypothetical protein
LEAFVMKAARSRTGLVIAPGLELPLDVVTDTVGVLAMKGSGKTYTALVLLEQMVGASLPVVALDPVGVFWGLRSSADGRGPGLPVILLGGRHADAPLEPGAGRAVADFIIAERQPTVLDLSEFRSKAEQQRFTREFLERLYDANRDALHVMIDEADDIAPQRPFGDEARLLRAVEVLVRRGRARGLGCTLITQRAAVLNKNVLTQVSMLILGRTIAPQDRKAIEAWVEVHGTPEQKAALLGSLAALPTREKWVWSPDRGIFVRVAIAARTTFDSSATPKVGSVRVEPKQLAAVDLDGLRRRIADTLERSKVDEPRTLRARVLQLEAELRAARAKMERTAIDREMHRALGQFAVTLASSGDYQKAADEVVRGIERLRVELVPAKAPASPPAAAPPWQPAPGRWAFRTNGAAYRGTDPLARPGAGGLGERDRRLGKCELALLHVLAQRAPNPTKRSQLAILSGYSGRSSGFANAIGALRSAHLVGGSRDAIHVTKAGAAAAGDVPPLPRGRELLSYWATRLGRCEAAILGVLADHYPAEVPRLELAKLTGYSATSSGFANAIGRLRTLALVEGFRASGELVTT